MLVRFRERIEDLVRRVVPGDAVVRWIERGLTMSAPLLPRVVVRRVERNIERLRLFFRDGGGKSADNFVSVPVPASAPASVPAPASATAPVPVSVVAPQVTLSLGPSRTARPAGFGLPVPNGAAPDVRTRTGRHARKKLKRRGNFRFFQ